MEENDDEPVIKVDLNINYNINNIINTANFNNTKDISTKSESEKEEMPQKKIGPRIKHQKRNKKEDIELQIACEDEEERKERLNQEKEKKKEIELKNKNLIYKIDEENYNCVDCGNSQSNFISINNGVTLCSNCAEIHKQFGNDISYILNINDELDEYLFNFIVFGSNSKFKKFLENENVDTKLNLKKKYKTNAVVFYRKNLKNKVEGKKLEEKFYQNPNDIYKNLENNDYPEFNNYLMKKCLIKNGEFKKQNKLLNLLSNLFKKKTTNKNKLLLRKKSSVKEQFILNDNINENVNNRNVNINNNKISMNIKKYKNSFDFDNDKIKESSRPFNEEKTEPDKNKETEEAPRIQSTSEHMISKVNDNTK